MSDAFAMPVLGGLAVSYKSVLLALIPSMDTETRLDVTAPEEESAITTTARAHVSPAITALDVR